MATNANERRNYAIAIAAATGNRVLFEDKKVREIVCDHCDGAGMHNGIPCAPCNRRGWTRHLKQAPAVEQFKIR